MDANLGNMNHFHIVQKLSYQFFFVLPNFQVCTLLITLLLIVIDIDMLYSSSSSNNSDNMNDSRRATIVTNSNK